MLSRREFIGSATALPAPIEQVKNSNNEVISEKRLVWVNEEDRVFSYRMGPIVGWGEMELHSDYFCRAFRLCSNDKTKSISMSQNSFYENIIYKTVSV
jgi:hypothetical protein